MKRKFNPILLIAVLWFAVTLFCWLKPAEEISDSERRKLDQFPKVTYSSILNGGFMEKFESASTDQFPFREELRKLKAVFSTGVLLQKDNHGIISYEGSLEKLNGPVNETSLQKAEEKLTGLYEKLFPDSAVYYAVIPEKGYYIPDSAGYPITDYGKLLQLDLPFAEKIDLTGTLQLSDYYRTDSHWRQELLPETAAVLAEAMGVTLSGSYTEETVKTDFLGVYAGQSGLPVKPESITILRNDILDGCTVYNYETGKTTGIYDLEALGNRDPYDVYLSGATPLLTIENPNATTDRELIIFRDSFGSSLIPLLCEAYRTVTVADIRYMPSAALPGYVDFHGQDVLLLYSTGVLNNSAMLR